MANSRANQNYIRRKDIDGFYYCHSSFCVYTTRNYLRVSNSYPARHEDSVCLRQQENIETLEKVVEIGFIL